MEYYSQYGQDKFAINEIFKGKREGFFLDVGAHNGIDLSNSYLLEKDYGWKGICIEANPLIYKQLVINRSSTPCVNTAVYSESKSSVNFVNADVYSGITSCIDKWKEVLETNDIIKVQTRTLTDVLDELKAPSYIDYFSLDTEGSEYEILKGIDFDRYKFGYITLEHNGMEPRKTEMRQFLKAKGYLLYKEMSGDDEFINAKFDNKS